MSALIESRTGHTSLKSQEVGTEQDANLEEESPEDECSVEEAKELHDDSDYHRQRREDADARSHLPQQRPKLPRLSGLLHPLSGMLLSGRGK